MGVFLLGAFSCIARAYAPELELGPRCQDNSALFQSTKTLARFVATHNHTFCTGPEGEHRFSCALRDDVWNGTVRVKTIDWLCRGTNLHLKQVGKWNFIVDAGCSGGKWRLFPHLMGYTSETAIRFYRTHNACNPHSEILDGLTWVVYGEDLGHTYEGSHELWTSFLTLLMMPVTERPQQVVFLFNYPAKHAPRPSPMVDVWRHMVADRLIFPSDGDTINNNTKQYCIKEAVFPLSSAKTIGTVESAKCPVLPLLIEYGTALLRSFHETRYDVAGHKVVIIARNSKPDNGTVELLRRSMTNVDELESAIRAEKNNSHVTWYVGRYNPTNQTVAEQIHHIRGADILISSHGAVLTWMMVLPRCAAVIEVGASNNWQYANLAKMLGIFYSNVMPVRQEHMSFEADVPQVISALRKLQVRRKKCARHPPTTPAPIDFPLPKVAVKVTKKPPVYQKRTSKPVAARVPPLEATIPSPAKQLPQRGHADAFISVGTITPVATTTTMSSRRSLWLAVICAIVSMVFVRLFGKRVLVLWRKRRVSLRDVLPAAAAADDSDTEARYSGARRRMKHGSTVDEVNVNISDKDEEPVRASLIGAAERREFHVDNDDVDSIEEELEGWRTRESRGYS